VTAHDGKDKPARPAASARRSNMIALQGARMEPPAPSLPFMKGRG
jgi:hypothetical protein